MKELLHHFMKRRMTNARPLVDMTKRSVFSLVFLCLGVFTLVLLSLQVYFSLVDEEDAVCFSEGEVSNSDISSEEKLKESRLGVVEDHAPVTSSVDEVTTRGAGVDEQWSKGML